MYNNNNNKKSEFVAKTQLQNVFTPCTIQVQWLEEFPVPQDLKEIERVSVSFVNHNYIKQLKF